MGTWKPVLPFAGSTVLETVVAAALAACPRVVLVTGYRGAEIERRFSGEPRVLAVRNEAWERGMFSSIQLGVERVRTRRFFITLGDLPWISAEVYRALLDGDEGSDAVFPVHGGRRGHPVLFRETVKPTVAGADPESGSMRLIAQSLRVREVPWPDDAILRDVDVPADLP